MRNLLVKKRMKLRRDSVKVLSPPETIWQNSTFRAKALRREPNLLNFKRSCVFCAFNCITDTDNVSFTVLRRNSSNFRGIVLKIWTTQWQLPNEMSFQIIVTGRSQISEKFGQKKWLPLFLYWPRPPLKNLLTWSSLLHSSASSLSKKVTNATGWRKIYQMYF